MNIFISLILLILFCVTLFICCYTQIEEHDDYYSKWLIPIGLLILFIISTLD
jgi:hypothetical protein